MESYYDFSGYASIAEDLKRTCDWVLKDCHSGMFLNQAGEFVEGEHNAKFFKCAYDAKQWARNKGLVASVYPKT